RSADDRLGVADPGGPATLDQDRRADEHDEPGGRTADAAENDGLTTGPSEPPRPLPVGLDDLEALADERRRGWRPHRWPNNERLPNLPTRPSRSVQGLQFEERPLGTGRF